MTRSAPEPGVAADGFRSALKKRDQDRRLRRTALFKAATAEPLPRNDLLPRLELVDRDPRSLKVPARNVRRIEAAHVREAANAIAALGFTHPVTIDREGTIIDGVVRKEAAILLGLPSISCVLVDHLNRTELRLLRLALNRLAEKGAWDVAELKVELEELIVEDAPIEITGFEVTDIDGILSETEPEQAMEESVEPKAGAQAVSRVGDLFRLGRHRVVCGDARDPEVVGRLMGDDEARLVFTDPPYNVAIAGHVTSGAHRDFVMGTGEMSADQFDAFNEAWAAVAYRHLIDGGVLAAFIDWRGLMSVTKAALTAGASQINLVVWGKTNAGMGSLYRSHHELLPLFKKGRAPHVNNVALGRKGRWRSNLWTYPGASSIGSEARQGLQHHPTVKPTDMLVDALCDLTNRGDIVLDPFLGSGSTLIAAESAGRVCRGIELDPLYVDVIVKRFEEVTGQHVILEGSGELFSVLAEQRLAKGSVSSDEAY